MHNGFGQCGFAAAAFADDTQCFARFEVERNGVEDGFVAFFKPTVRFFDGKGDVFGLEYGGRVFRQGGDAACCAGIEQHFGVFMLRIGEDFGGFAGFEDAAVTHNGDVVGKTAHEV